MTTIGDHLRMSHSHNSTTAFAERPLTRKERSRYDTYVFFSPKQNKIVEVTNVVALAFFLEREFDPKIEACVPRPRLLTLPDRRTVELDFWTRTRDGQENFWVLIGKNDIEKGPSAIVPRDESLWTRAAQTAGLMLDFIFEHQIDRRAQRAANCLRMLPHVQAARRRPHIHVVADRIRELYGRGIDGLTFEQIEAGLKDFAAVDTCTAACVLVHAGALTFDMDLPLTRRTTLRLGGVA